MPLTESVQVFGAQEQSQPVGVLGSQFPLLQNPVGQSASNVHGVPDELEEEELLEEEHPNIAL